MPFLNASDYKPALPLQNGHINTLYPYFFRNQSVPWQSRQRIKTTDGDFFDTDYIRHPNNTKLLVLLHGLEGSSASHYMKGFGHLFGSNGFDVAAVHFRSCSGEINEGKILYHSGFIRDVEYFLEKESTQYKELYLCGFSLGGSVCLNYLGRIAGSIPPNVVAAAAVSVPIDLLTSSLRLKKWYNTMYTRRFLTSLKRKMNIKSGQFPDLIHHNSVMQSKSLWEFDEKCTAPIHGFSSAEEYYIQCSARPWLENITIPAAIINALDDSFLSPECFPFELAAGHPYLHLMAPDNGGHVGFSSFGKAPYWIEQVVFHFFNTINR